MHTLLPMAFLVSLGNQVPEYVADGYDTETKLLSLRSREAERAAAAQGRRVRTAAGGMLFVMSSESDQVGSAACGTFCRQDTEQNGSSCFHSTPPPPVYFLDCTTQSTSC